VFFASGQKAFYITNLLWYALDFILIRSHGFLHSRMKIIIRVHNLAGFMPVPGIDFSTILTQLSPKKEAY
jgi:hypothetical protein